MEILLALGFMLAVILIIGISIHIALSDADDKNDPRADHDDPWRK